MYSLQDCIDNTRKILKERMIATEIQDRLLQRISAYMTATPEIVDSKLQIYEAHLYSIDELFDLLYIHPHQKTAFAHEMGNWKTYHYRIQERSYFSLFDLVSSYAFLESIAPLTLYAMSSSEKGDRR